jgi:hypothetical protein
MPLLSYRGLLNTLPPSAERPPLAERATTRSDISLPPIQSLLSPPSPPPPPCTSLPEAPCTPKREKAAETTRSDRIRIKTALAFGHTPQEIRDKLGFTLRQIQWAKHARLMPQRNKTGLYGKPAIRSPQRACLEAWLQGSPSRRRVPWRYIPYIAPELGLNHGALAMNKAFKLLGYGRRVAKRKGYSDDPEVWAERLAFAEWAIIWTRERLRCQIFSDEVWAMGGQYTRSYVTAKLDGSERFHAPCVDHKYSKQPAWMFHGTIVDGKKGPCCFWEKRWGNMNSFNYDRIILSSIQEWIRTHPGRDWVWMQDNASCHRSAETRANLRLRGIPAMPWPRYSPDLNLIEYVWSWMEDWIQEHHRAAYYDASRIPLRQLRTIIEAAWNAVPDSYIEHLLDSWYRRCQAVIDARGGPTRY